MSKEIVQHFNKLLTNELTSVRQYLLHFAILKNNGINRFAEKTQSELNEELEHANRLAERILSLKVCQISKTQTKSQSVMEIYKRYNTENLRS